MTELPPVSFDRPRPGLREICLLLIGLGFTLIMFDLSNLAIIAGWAMVGVWLYAMVIGPRPTPGLTAIYGGGLFVTYFWWPDQGWWLEAIGLMWVGIGMMAFALVWWLASRNQTS